MHCVSPNRRTAVRPFVAYVGKFQPIRFAQHAADRVEFVHHAIQQHEMIRVARQGICVADRGCDARLIVRGEARGDVGSERRTFVQSGNAHT